MERFCPECGGALFTWSICRKVQRLFRPLPNLADSIYTGHRGDLCWTAASCCAHHSPVCVTLARHRAESRKSQVPVHRLPLFPSAALFTDVASTCNPNTSILQVLHYPNKALDNFKKETLTQKYLIIRQLSCSSKWDTALFLRWNPPVHSAFNSPSLL